MKNIIIFFSAFILFTSCLKNNQDATWIKINKWSLTDNQNLDEGQLTEAFTNVKVLVDGDVIGIFELPIKIPIINKEGDKLIQLFPVVVNNGISATKKVYPFMTRYDVTKNFKPNDTITLNPTTQYISSVNFWIEDFDGASIKITNDAVSTDSIKGSDDPAIIQPFNGNKFGRVEMDGSGSVWLGFTGNNTNGINIPRGVDSYLEVDYHLDTDLTTAVLGIGASGVIENPMIRINKQSTPKWKKIYIELKEVVSGLTQADYYKISFRANLPEGITSGQINIDNIKVVYF